MNRRLTKLTAAVFLSAFTVVLTLLLINSPVFDETPSKEVQRLSQTIPLDYRPDNAYFAVFGFRAASDKDITDAGIRLTQRYLENREARQNDALTQGDYAELLAAPPTDDGLLKQLPQCNSRSDITCSQKTLAQFSGEVMEQPRIAQLVQRYQTIIKMPYFKELQSITVASPLPEYGALIKISRAHLLHTYKSTGIDAFLSALKSDTTFWRQLLTQGDHLITKMVAVAAIWNNLQLANEIVRNNELSETQSNLLLTILKPLTKEELDISEAIEFESKALFSVLEVATALENDEWLYKTDLLYQPNASKNLFWEQLAPVLHAAKMPPQQIYPNFIEIQSRLAERSEPLPLSLSSLYNPTGKAIISIGTPNYLDYIARVHDLNAMIHLTEKAVKIHQNRNMAPSEINAILHPNQSAMSNPPITYSLDDSKNKIGVSCLDAHNKCQLFIK